MELGAEPVVVGCVSVVVVRTPAAIACVLGMDALALSAVAVRALSLYTVAVGLLFQAPPGRADAVSALFSLPQPIMPMQMSTARTVAIQSEHGPANTGLLKS